MTVQTKRKHPDYNGTLIGPRQQLVVIEECELIEQGYIHFTYCGEENQYGTRASDGAMVCYKYYQDYFTTTAGYNWLEGDAQ